MTRILCLNANTSRHITETVSAEMRATLGPAVEVIECTARFGPDVIRTRIDHAVAMHGIVDAAAAHAGTVDAIMLAVSFDTGRGALREALSVPVVGMSEASVAMARMTGHRLGYVSLGADVKPLYEETLGHCDLDRDRAGWVTLDAPSAYRPGETSELDAMLVGASQSLADAGCDVLVLLGAVLAGAARRLRSQTSIPMIDGGTAGALMAHAMVELGAVSFKAAKRVGTERRGLSGVSDALSTLQRLK